LGVGGHKFRRALFESLLEQKNIHQISPCYAYRHQTGTEEEYTASLIQELMNTIEDIGPKKVAGFIFEPVVGTALGCVTATKGYIPQVRDVCDRYGILMVCDEVMCGMDRCSDGQSLHAWTSFLDISGVEKDVKKREKHKISYSTHYVFPIYSHIY
jgi:adenosylmethionine-8-amino-7-oxononanoate aminotransferase